MATDTTLSMSPSELSKRKKSFLFEEEDIVMKPSTELFPDEYKHGKILLHIFRTTFDRSLDDNFNITLRDVNSKINYHEISTSKQFTEDLDLISKDTVDKDGVVLIFVGFFEKDGCIYMIDEKESSLQNFPIKYIWNQFSTKKCPQLAYKPKIFIFCTSKKPPGRLQTDSKLHKTVQFDKVYDIPAEADMLIIYKKIDDNFVDVKEDFMARFCTTVRNYSRKHDIIELITLSQAENDKSIPLIISTLTSKFYLAPNNERSLPLSITENSKDLETTLKTIHDHIHQWHEGQNKKKKEKRLLSFAKSFSFKKKFEEKPNIMEKATPQEKPKISKTVTDSSSPRLSATSLSGSRSRSQSESEYSKFRISNSDKNKPKWRN